MYPTVPSVPSGLPAMKTSDVPGMKIGPADPRSQPFSVSDAQLDGAHSETTCTLGDSSNSASPPSNVVVDAPFPDATKRSPAEFTTAPLVDQMAPSVRDGTWNRVDAPTPLWGTPTTIPW